MAQHTIEQFILICLDSIPNQLVDYLPRFRHLMNCVKHFDDSNSCFEHITNIKNDQVLLIMTIDHVELIPTIYRIRQIYSIYIFKLNRISLSNNDPFHYRKVRGQFDTVDRLYTQMEYDKKCLASNLITLNNFSPCILITHDTADGQDKTNMQETKFMYSQIIRDIFINENYTDVDKKEMIDFFRQEYNDNKIELEKIGRFDCEYTIDRAIYWYTIDGFLYRTINKALRTQDILILYHLRYFIKDLHLELKKYHSMQCSYSSTEALIVYRGLGLPHEEFEKLQIGHLVSFSEFISTSRNRELADVYIKRGFDDMQSVLFEIELSYRISTSTPFADISGYSQFDSEEEILLSMGSVFRIESVDHTGDDHWHIKLRLTSDEDEELKVLYQWLNQAILQVKHLYTKLSSLMLFIRDYDKAEFFLKKVMSQPGFSQDIQTICATSSIFGEINFHQNKLEQATLLYQKTIELFETHPEQIVSSTLQRCYTGLSEIYLEKAQLMKALEYSQKSLSIVLSDDYMKSIDLLLATRYNNIGHIYYKLNNIEQALSFLQTALDRTKSLPSNIPILSKIYSNLAMTYEQSGDYSKSELCWEKSLEHHLKSMPNDTDSTSYLLQAVAMNLVDHKKYNESIEYLKKSLSLCKSQGQHTLCCCYKGLADAYHGLKDFQQAAMYLQRTIDIAHTISSLDLGVLYIDSGNNYYAARDYDRALVSYTKALEFAQSSAIPSTHMKILITYTQRNQPNPALDHYRLHIEPRTEDFDQNDRALISYYVGVNYWD